MAVTPSSVQRVALINSEDGGACLLPPHKIGKNFFFPLRRFLLEREEHRLALLLESCLQN